MLLFANSSLHEEFMINILSNSFNGKYKLDWNFYLFYLFIVNYIYRIQKT